MSDTDEKEWEFTHGEIQRHEKYLRVGRSKIPKAGKGVFAKCDIPKNRWVGTMTGPWVGHNGKHVLWVESYFHEGLYDLIDIQGPLRYANHSNDPNVKLGGDPWRPSVYALKDIKAGEEILWDYEIPAEELQAGFDENYGTDLEYLSPMALGLWLKENNAMNALDVLVAAAETIQERDELLKKGKTDDDQGSGN